MIQQVTPVSEAALNSSLLVDRKSKHHDPDLSWRIFKYVMIFGCILQVFLGIGSITRYVTTNVELYGGAKHWFPYIGLFQIGWFFAVPLVAVVVSDLRLSRRRLALYLFLVYLSCFVGYAIVFHEIEHWIMRNFFTGNPGTNWICYGKNYYWLSSLTNTASKFPVFLLLGLSIRFWFQQDQTRRKSAELDNLVANLRHESLCNRVRPHFLFNTLNTVASLSNSQPDLAREIIGRLGTLLRESLDAMDAKRISLAHEYSLLEDYLAIQKARYGHSLSYQLVLPEELQDRVVPVLFSSRWWKTV